MTHPQPKAAAGVDLPSYEEALLDAGKARALFDASKGGNVRGITEDHRFALAQVFSVKPAPTIKFVRVARDCPHNSDLVLAGDARGFIYDFDVMIDGERRAQLRRDYTGVGYHLHDADGRPIHRPDARRTAVGEFVNRKPDFECVTLAFLEAGLIPTLARMAELRAEEEAKLNARRAEVAEDYRQRRIRGAGVQLYDALKVTLDALRSGAGFEEKMNAARIAIASIAEAEMTHPTDAEQIEYEAKHR